ncbi:hypothetical protein EHT25_16335 [Larkinella rosea]|uniref:DUF6371 domain-containing protein n=2 Tax=Larkinella rosea TaxID=2025312 RepID=A0A3P1BM06_9BACT|nr:hypothetical protein EHT25_16335 [Larkinella rosea]
MAYDARTGRRRKRADGSGQIDWWHNKVGEKPYHLRQCFFGEHLLKTRPKAPVAVVESEKTALVAGIYFPQFIWIASGGLSLLSRERCSALRGRQIYLFPDLNGYEKWKEKATGIAQIAKVVVSDLLEKIATPEERKQGFDLADYLLKFDPKDFREIQLKAPAGPNKHSTILRLEKSPDFDLGYPALWDAKPREKESLRLVLSPRRAEWAKMLGVAEDQLAIYSFQP